MRVHARSFALTDAIHKHVLHQVNPVLEACNIHPDAAQVWLDDVNGDRGGEDKRCRIAITGRVAGEVVVDAVHHDLYTAIDAASSRLKGALRRRLQRHRTLQRGPATTWTSLTFWGSPGQEPTPAA